VNRVISCREAVRQLWRFLDGELETSEQQSIEEHLDHCVHCCGELEFSRALRQLLDSQRTSDLPADVRDRLEHFIDELNDTSEEGMS
jgi:mycothiol system anti-sigma-R factor